ncbi:kinase-like domain-containing protein [Cantharellus anzutake]|uniref:kinase-like domain-containing protein n=1 Tax=Cantharellus anzutake TaxID=1750568 RepID=UPI0019080F94|nr:kinase-like domain-containing protein [Cantharellus anzutake]KAF8338115.1 kinase-like domain-containing protein [Cantharellus anzutake]
MTALPGTPLLDSFLEMSEADLARVQETLRNWVDQLRALPSPTESVCAVDGGPCLSYRVSTHPFGPFSSIREFHNRFYKIVPGEHQDRLRALAEASHSRPHRLCFTHGDISPANVLVSGNQLTGLVDWECSGWYPEYYEYTMAVYRRQRAQKWWDLWAKIFPQYKTEVEVELAFWAVDFPW